MQREVLATRGFAKLNRWGDGRYTVTADGRFVRELAVASDYEAIEKFMFENFREGEPVKRKPEDARMNIVVEFITCLETMANLEKNGERDTAVEDRMKIYWQLLERFDCYRGIIAMKLKNAMKLVLKVEKIEIEKGKRK